MSDGKLTAWIGVARFRITGNTQRKVPELRTVELMPGDVVLRNAQRLYRRAGYEKKRTKAITS